MPERGWGSVHEHQRHYDQLWTDNTQSKNTHTLIHIHIYKYKDTHSNVGNGDGVGDGVGGQVWPCRTIRGKRNRQIKIQQ